MKADKYIAQGLIDASDVYDIPVVADEPAIREVFIPDAPGHWVIFKNTFGATGPFATDADARDFISGCDPDDPICPRDPEQAVVLHLVQKFPDNNTGGK